MNFGEIPFIKKHTELYETDPEKAHIWDSGEAGGSGPLPTLLLTTRGRKSGKPRSSPLIYQPWGEGWVVIASKGGFPTHPLWYENLVADPECDLQIGARRVQARARLIEGEERAKVWKMMRDVYPPYDDYQKATEREIPVILLESRD